ncbi:MAG: IclR family transcriptional regulator [Sphingobium sp.]|nr:IclR family transcriptional regulator [Sphingobium sp.]MBP8670455.1 IclR family transcriptional regulator [Sphingobium sp.]MBP9156890.1 IclR family transcriptional regulator [Sphingobium sp.]MCC6481984.1 IclR family transcriptional regulator [Sphingomonadaceae bacterium]
MRNGTPSILSSSRTLAMLESVISDGGTSSITALARASGVPVPTAHRQVHTLVEAGWLSSTVNGRHVAGPRLIGLLHRLDEKQIIANIAAPMLHRLAAKVRCIVQLGTYENEMVTYRIKTGQGASGLFPRIGMQLEAYCSGIGKVLLANLPAAERTAYLANGPFVPLTERTITNPALLAEELTLVAGQGYAVDDGEIAHGLVCIAVPIRKPDGSVPAAISVSRFETEQSRPDRETITALLRSAAQEIETAAFPH